MDQTNAETQSSTVSNVTIYTLHNDVFSWRAKKLLDRKGISYTEQVVGNAPPDDQRARITAEQFTAAVPNVRRPPVTMINGETVVGLRALTKKLG